MKRNEEVMKRIDQKTFISLLIAFFIISLLIYVGNPSAPSRLFKIENGDIRVEAYDKSGDMIGSVFLGDTELLAVSGKDTAVVVDGKKVSLASIFNSTKKVDVQENKEYKELIVYYDKEGERAGYTFRLWNSSRLDIFPFVRAENMSVGTAEAGFLYRVKLDQIRQNGLVRNKGSLAWRAEDYYVPVAGSYQDVYYSSGSFRMAYQGALSAVNNLNKRTALVSLPRKHGEYPAVVLDFSGQDVTSQSGLLIVAPEDIADSSISVSYEDKELFKLDAGASMLDYKGSSMALFGKGNSWFDQNDRKTGTVRKSETGHQLEIKWVNNSKDPSAAGFRITRSDSDQVVSITMFADSKYPDRMGGAVYGIKYSGYNKIFTPTFKVIDTSQKSSIIEKFNEFRIPPVFSTGIEKFISEDLKYSLELTSDANIEQIDNLLKNGVIKVYISNYSQGNSINFSGVSLRLSDDTEYKTREDEQSIYILTTGKSNDQNVKLFYSNTALMSFSGWNAVFSFNNTVKHLYAAKNKEDEGLFTEKDSKRVTVSENSTGYTMKVSWYNSAKDPDEAGWIFTVLKNDSRIKVELFFNSSHKLDGLAPGFTLKDVDIYHPGSMVKNDNKSSQLIETGVVAFGSGSSALLMYSPGMAYLRSYFKTQGFRPVLLDPVPLYLEYYPQAKLFYNGSLHMSTPDYSGDVRGYINKSLPAADRNYTTRILQLQGKLAREPLEIRGPIFNISAGSKIVVKPATFPGYEDYSLELNFSGNGRVEKGGARYTAQADKNKKIWFLDQRYQSLDSGRADLLSKVLLSKDELTLKIGEIYSMKDGYSIELADVSQEGESIFIRLSKYDEVLDQSSIPKKGKYVYNRSISRNKTLVGFEVENALYNENKSAAFLKNFSQYSDELLEIKTGDRYGIFQVTAITGDKIIMENREPLEFRKGKKTLLLDETVGLNVSENSWRGYIFRNEKLPGKYRARGIFYKNGVWYPATKNNILSFDASNFSGFYYDFKTNTSYESFTAMFSNDGEIGNAYYTAYIHNKNVWFMGNKYEVFGKVLNNKILDTNTSVRMGKPLLLSGGYSLLLEDIDAQSSSARLVLKNKDKVVVKDIVKKGKLFKYEKKIGSEDVPIIVARIDEIFRVGIIDGIVTLDLKQYSDSPFKLELGDVYGPFKVNQIDSSRIILKLNKKIPLSKNAVVKVLGDYLKLQVKENEWKVYPFVEVESEKVGEI